MNQTSSEKSKTEVDGGLRLKQRLLLGFRVAIGLSVVAALVWTIGKASAELRSQPMDLSQVKYGRLVLAVLAYLLTMTLSWAFWHRVLISLKQKPSLLKSLKAFFISQLGKYVPGKAMVVILRTDLVQDSKVSVAPAGASVFIETLTWIFVGGMIACLLLAFQSHEYRSLQIAALVLMLVSGVLTWPPVFNKVASKIKPPATSALTYAVDFRTMAIGWLLLTIGWCFNALSLWLVVGCLPGVEPSPNDLPLMLAAVTLATVGGFVSLLPGGLGVRELVMIPLLGSQFGTAPAVVAAILVRFVWLSAELLASAIMTMVGVVGSHSSQVNKEE